MGVGLKEVGDQGVGGEGAGQVMEGDAIGDVRFTRRDMAGDTAEGIEQSTANGGLGLGQGG
jgi:hypothetical protein